MLHGLLKLLRPLLSTEPLTPKNGSPLEAWLKSATEKDRWFLEVHKSFPRAALCS